MSSWNIRLVHVLDTYLDGEDSYYEFREVFYDDDGTPTGHSRLHTQCNNPEEAQKLIENLQYAIKRPLLCESDFIYENDDDEWTHGSWEED